MRLIVGKTFRKSPKGEEDHQDKDRKNMRGARSCLNHGGCDWCKGNRTYKFFRDQPVVEEEEYFQKIEGD